MTLFRTVWIRPEELQAFETHAPILPGGVGSVRELDGLRFAAINNFGSLRNAALHHLTGATGTEPNVSGKPVFTFWTRDRGVAVRHGVRSHPGRAGLMLVLIEAQVEAGEGVVVALDEGLYHERISDTMPDTFSEFRGEDEVFISLPVTAYRWSVIEAAPGSTARN